MKNQGYSAKLIRANQEADPNNVGVLLGRVCIMLDISVSQVASLLNVSRPTVYFWFTGTVIPHPTKAKEIQALILELHADGGL
jgi:hypothetical protein